MTGCDEERERIRQQLAARVTRMTDTQREASKPLQDAYAQRRRIYLTTISKEQPIIQPETARGEAKADDEHLPHPADSKLLL